MNSHCDDSQSLVSNMLHVHFLAVIVSSQPQFVLSYGSTTRLSAYEQFLKLSAQEYATTTSADNAAVLNLSSIGKAAESDLMLRHVNVAAAMAAAAVGNVGAVEGSAVVGANSCERN